MVNAYTTLIFIKPATTGKMNHRAVVGYWHIAFFSVPDLSGRGAALEGYRPRRCGLPFDARRAAPSTQGEDNELAVSQLIGIPDRRAAASPKSIINLRGRRALIVVMDSAFLAELVIGPARGPHRASAMGCPAGTH